MMILKMRWMVILFAFLLDAVLGDPVWQYHPVRLMGKMITSLEAGLRRRFPPRKAGILMAFAMVLFWFVLPAGILWVCYGLSWYAGVIVESILCYQMIAAKDLCVESHRVYKALQTGDVELARKNVSMIVGRDTQALSKEGIIRAAVETIAENTSDGVIAPLFYMFFGGAPLAVCYKAVNTMDSMVGYHNEKYEEFGFGAARLDDVVNFLPARLSALLMIVAAGLLGLDGKNAFRIFKRDRLLHKSPNSGQTEAVCAGALGVRLAGDAWYFGVLHKKPYIGDGLREIEEKDIVRTEKLMYLTTILMVFLCVLAGVLL